MGELVPVQAGPRRQAVTATAVRGLSRFAEARGVPPGGEFLLGYDVIEAFCVTGLRGRTCSTRGTYRSALYRLAEATHGPPGQRATPFPGAKAPAPYSPAERAELAAVAAAQRDPAKRSSALAMVVFGIGAGLRPGELVALRGDEIFRRGRQVMVLVTQQRLGWERRGCRLDALHMRAGGSAGTVTPEPLVELQAGRDAARDQVEHVPGSPGQLVVLGGLTPAGTSASGVYALRTATGAARQIGALSARLHDAAGVTSGGRALVFGGGSPVTVGTVQAFSGAGTARVTGSLPAPRSDAGAVTIGGTAYVVGGYDGSKPDASVLATTDGRTFATVAALPVPVRYPAVAALDGMIYAFGGQAITGPDAGAAVNVIQVVDPARHTAAVIGRLPEPLAGAAAVTVGSEGSWPAATAPRPGGRPRASARPSCPAGPGRAVPPCRRSGPSTPPLGGCCRPADSRCRYLMPRP
jgi:hypothetical protein